MDKSACSNEDPAVANFISDDFTLEPTNENEPNETIENELAKASIEDDKTKVELEPSNTRTRKLTEKGREERIRKLRNDQITALKAVTRKRTDITKLMNDENNLEIVKNQLTELDRLCQHYEDYHNEYLDALSSPEDKEEASTHFEFKENDIFEYRKRVANWISTCEQRLSDQFDNLSGRHSHKSRSSKNSKNSSLSSRTKEKAKVAELIAERSMLKQRLELKVAEEEYPLDLKIAKARARERVLAEMEEQEDYKNLTESHAKPLSPTLPVTLPTLSRDVTPSLAQYVTPLPSKRVELPELKRESPSLPFMPSHETHGVDHVKREGETYHQLSPLDPQAPEFLPLSHEI